MRWWWEVLNTMVVRGCTKLALRILNRTKSEFGTDKRVNQSGAGGPKVRYRKTPSLKILINGNINAVT